MKNKITLYSTYDSHYINIAIYLFICGELQAYSVSNFSDMYCKLNNKNIWYFTFIRYLNKLKKLNSTAIIYFAKQYWKFAI